MSLQLVMGVSLLGANAAPLRWEAPAECPSAAQVQAKIEEHLGAPLSTVEIAWSAAGTITRDESGFSLALAIETPDGRHDRPLHDPNDCAVVTDAAALLIAIALDPEAADPATPTAEQEAVAAETRATVPPLSPAPVSPPPRAVDRSPRVRGAVGAAGGLDLGTLPRIAPAVHGSVALLFRRARVGVVGSFGSVSHHELPRTPGAASVSWWSLGVEGGPVLRARAFEFPLLFGAEAGQLHARPIDLFAPQRQRAPWAAVLVLPGAAYVPVPWLSVVARVGVAVPLAHPRFQVEGLGEIHRPAWVALRASVGIELRFPGAR
jgi:hypothetical protein